MTEELASLCLPAFMSREEMKNLLLSEEYGYLPPPPHAETFSMEKDVVPRFCAGKAHLHIVTAETENAHGSFCFPIRYAVPEGEGPFPFFVHLNFRPDVPDRHQPTEEILDNGFAVLSFCYQEVTKDNGDFADGLAGVVYPYGRGLRDGGKLSLWAWAASRVLDFAETRPELDLTHAMVIGHSRLGKTALLAALCDPRFTHACSNDSGCCGAALHRGQGEAGEKIRDIVTRFPFWFSRGFASCPDADPETLPYDQHFLLAGIAPRPVLISSADGDAWADPSSEFRCAKAASAFYEEMGVPGLAAQEMPSSGEASLEGNVGYHLRKGMHYLSREDWHAAMAFLKMH